VIDYNHNKGIRFEGAVLHINIVETKKMTKWYLKFFKRLLNSTVLSSFVA
jgi:hypothetical protein